MKSESKLQLHEVFVHNLHQIYYVEHYLLEALEKLSDRVGSKAAREDLLEHRKETKEHVKRIEDVFYLVGLQPREMKEREWEVMDKELDHMLKQVSDDSRDFLLLQAAAKAERLEISHYEVLILASKELDIPEKSLVLSLLRDNLREEEHALKKAISGMKSQISFWKRNIH